MGVVGEDADHVSEVKFTSLRAKLCKWEFQCVSDHLMVQVFTVETAAICSVKYVLHPRSALGQRPCRWLPIFPLINPASLPLQHRNGCQ
jgi:hypothetical protein